MGIFIAYAFLSLVSTCCLAYSSLLTDFQALLELKQGFESPEPALSSWTSSRPASLCSWARIQCSSLPARVISVNLTDLSLSGHVSSAALSKLDALSELSLSGNNFSGEIEVSGLGNLKLLNISNNQFNGGLDWSFSTIPSLQVLDAYNNNFTASLPVGILALKKKLRYLDLGGNYFFGQIPASYGDLVELRYLSLAGNDLSGKIPGELGSLVNLREIYLGYYNVFEGGIPKELGSLESLVHMDLSNCELDGQIPKEIGDLNSLDTLYLHANLLSGQIPRHLGNLTTLLNLDLSNNALAGEIPPEFSNLRRLRLLNLFMNRLHGSVPDFLAADLPELETLGLWMNNFTGVIPPRLGRSGSLQVLDLSSNKLTGTIPAGLCSSNRLRILILLRNFLLGPIPESLGSCSSLTRVRLGENYLNGSIPDGFIYLPLLNLLELQDNYLSGPLSENRNVSSGPTKLGQINLSNNRLSGRLPDSIANFSSVQIVLLSGNRFSGAIPATIGGLRQVLKLDLSRNSLSGQIPAEMGACSQVTYLDMSQNNLSGAVPAEISGMRILNFLNLSRNRLSEGIPASIGAMKSLTTADFSFNEFSGEVPETGQFAFFNATSFAGNPRLCGAGSNPCKASGWSSEAAAAGGSDGQESKLKLVFAVGLLMCSLIFAVAAVAKARAVRLGGKGRELRWRMTSFQKVGFGVEEVVECVKEGNVIGRGGAGVVYHGRMGDGSEVAVKKLLGWSARNDHGFRAEIQTLGSIRHRNIVRLLAYCSNKETKLLVYEYMANGSLGDALHPKKGSNCFLPWDLRFNIALQAARGLCYLHHDCSPLILHRDVKSNNILLGPHFEAHLADFGLAKFLLHGATSECMSAIAGSYGYIAPEYAYTLKVDEKSDVYSFGVVVLELLTGRRPVGDHFGEGVDIVQWCKKATSSTTARREDLVMQILDRRLTNNNNNNSSLVVPKEEATHLFFVASLCIQDNSVERPTMREVVQMLSEFPRHNSPSSSTSTSNTLNHTSATQHSLL